MKRTLVLLLLFLLLGGGTWYMMKNQDTHSTTSSLTDGDFAVRNESNIHKIFIAERNGKTTTLERNGDHWTYNGQFKARPNVMTRLLEVVTKVEMKYTTPRAAEKNMLNNLATQGVKVEIYNKANDLLKAYYVGGSTADGYGTFMIMEGAKEPYITHIPNFEGTIRGRFTKMLDTDWRDRTLFAEDIENIQSVIVEYPKQKSKSFKLEREGSQFKVEPFNDASPKNSQPLSQAQVEKYLIGFKSITAEDFENDNVHRDSVTAMLPFARVSLKNKDGEGMAANFHPLIRKNIYGDVLSKVEQSQLSDATVRYYVNCSDGSFRLAQHRVVGKMFLDYNQFFKN